MGRRVLRHHIWGYSVCLCPTKGKPDLNELITEFSKIIKNEKLSRFFFFIFAQNIDCGYMLEPPKLWIKNKEKIPVYVYHGVPQF